jgi:hypothetical protein
MKVPVEDAVALIDDADFALFVEHLDCALFVHQNRSFCRKFSASSSTTNSSFVDKEATLCYSHVARQVMSYQLLAQSLL